MSRIGKKPIALPKGVTVKVVDGALDVQGPKGKMRQATPPGINFAVADGIAEIPIEQRSPDEVATMTGRTADGRIETVRIVPEGSAVANYGFDVTPARLITGLITERGVSVASPEGLASLYPQQAGSDPSQPRRR